MDLRELSTFFFLSYQTEEIMRGKRRESWKANEEKKLREEKGEKKEERLVDSDLQVKKEGIISRHLIFFALLGLMMGFG